MVENKFALHLDDENPWPGLAAYDEGSKGFFHGRDRESAELLRLIRLCPFVALYGKSGLGKSSMLQAGLFPQLRAARFLPVHLRLDYTEKAGQPLMTQAALRLRQEIDAAGADAPQAGPDESLWAYLQRRERPIWTRDNYPLTPVLVFDQFEEVFSRGGSPERVQAVLESMADLVGDRVPAALADDRGAARSLNLQSQQYRVVLSFRSDFLADVEGWERQANLPRRESLHLTAMSPERAVEAVESAGEKVLEPGVAKQIVDFLLQREGRAAPGRAAEVEPVLLSLCCYQLNRRRLRPAKIDAALLNEIGDRILKGFYDEALKGMPPEVSRFIEDHLIQGRYRNSYALDEALASRKLTRQQLDQLMESRLLRVDPQGDVPRIELIHDRLVSVVREALDERLAREQAEAGARAEREKQQRLREEAEERAKAERLAQSEREGARVARWRNGLAVAVAGLVFAMAMLFVIWRGDRERTKQALDRAEKADNEKNILESDRLNLELEVKQLKAERAARPTRTPPPDTEATPAAGAIPAAAGATGARTLDIPGWRLNSGDCQLGEVTVTGTVRIAIKTDADGFFAEGQFGGTSPEGFKVTVTGRSKSSKDRQNQYEIETKGDWKGPGGRSFTTTGLDVVYTNKAGDPVRVRFRKIARQCS